MANKSILILVEGEKTDVRLMKQVMSLYGLQDYYNIVAYKTNIYVLYKQIFKEGTAYGSDLLQTLVENEESLILKEMFKQNNAHIILCFDLDPQDSEYSEEKIIALSNYFNESTENGKLYLNYPMIESFSHCNKDDNEYINRVVKMVDIPNYKSIVGKFNHDPRKLYENVELMTKIIMQNLTKANEINKMPKIDYHVDLQLVLQAQIQKIKDDNSLFVLCTCIFFILDYNKELVLKHII